MKALLTITLPLIFVLSTTAADWIHLPPKVGTANGKKIVFVTGDDEYKSETSMPMMAHILAEYHGFDCTVLFAIHRSSGVIDTNQRDHIPGLEALADADLMVIFTRFRTLVDEQMKMIEDYLATGKPIIGLRTATHAFDFSKAPDHAYAKYGYAEAGTDYTGGFGKQVLGETWIRHWGHHGRQSTRGRFAPGQENHPILRGIADGDIWGPTDVYEVTLPLPKGCQPILLGEVCESMDPNASPAPAPPADAQGRHAINKNDPMMPVSWTWQRDVGAKGRVFTSTFGGAMAGKDDWANEGTRRMFVNACYWTLSMEDQIPAKAEVTPVLQPNPFRRGVKPADALAQGLATKAAKDATILFYGNSMIERLLEHGEMEARLQITLPDHKLKIRSLAWTGDEVGNRLRLEGYAKHMKNLLDAWPANTIVLGYGQNEAFAGAEGLEDFKQQYAIHLDQLSRVHPGARFVLLSPIAPNRSRELQANAELYSAAIAELAKVHGATFVDLHAHTTDLLENLTVNGIHLNDNGNSLVAHKVADELLATLGQPPSAEIDLKHLREVAQAASAKHYRVAEVVRPKNAVVYFGVRARAAEYNAEMPRYHEMIRLTEEVVHQLAAHPTQRFADLPKPSLPPMGESKGHDDGDRTGIIKSVAEAQAEFIVADGYAVNLFASEEQFPELRNPVQIAFDARGRLWVVTMPSFPHTVPGLAPPDKIIVLEDRDRDGKADKLTTFADGLDALDGVAFHRDGVIISEQPYLYFMRDTDGDGRADTKEELLRGIDVTDSHHGGMITTDPYGDVIFSDGVFHRSQLETPFGVHRGIDATTYRLDPISGRINTEWQHTTPNPWNVTFDRWGNTFQVYGDGHVYDGSALIWTPLGAYHPFRYAHVASYGKGSGGAVISSPNFPDTYNQGIASAALLGRYAVTLTTLDREEGLVKATSNETILSSHNAAFRPADVEFGMDGALYVSDFCSPIIGHAQHPMRDPHWDHEYGRIWRIVHTEKPVAKDWPVIEGAEVKALCELLVHPQDLVRHHARIELRKHGEKGLQAVDQWLAKQGPSSSKYDQAALETLFVCEGLGQTRPALIKHLLKSESALYRGAAVQVIRQQADRLDELAAMLATAAADPHPRVQIEVIDAVAHLRPDHPGVELCLANMKPANQHVEKSMAYLNLGTEPVKGRSVPVLEVAREAQLTQWLWLGNEGVDAPTEMQVGKDKLPGEGLFRTFVYSDTAQPAVVGINHKRLEIRLNGVMVFRQDSLWSGDQQVQVELEPGLNVLEIMLLKGRGSRNLPAVSLYDPVGQALSSARYLKDVDSLRSAAAEYEKLVTERGNILRVQAATGLQFAPKKLRVIAGSKVLLVFDNPDVMMHNWVLLAPGSTDAIGKLADEMAGLPDGYQKGYLPESEKILVASKLLAPKETQEIVFQAPSEPGEYPYICTFPGHWRVMQGVLSVVNKPTPKPKPKNPPAAKGESKIVTSDGVTIESADSPAAFMTLKPTANNAKVTTNRTTSNDPIATVTDGKLAKSFGPVFGNGIKDGMYKMDLGAVKPVSAITSWSFNMGGRRGAQKVTLYGSNAAGDPGWNLSSFTKLGAINTGAAKADFTAASLRGKAGKSLGNFRWIVWAVSPISTLGDGENSAIQEVGVEIGQSAAQEPEMKTHSLPLPKVRGQIVRIMLPGGGKTLSLAEVGVFAQGENLALNKPAKQSSTGFSGDPGRAVDGNSDGDYMNHSVTHTEGNRVDPWWEVDLGEMADIEQISVYNRTDSLGSRLEGFTLQILDVERKVLFTQEKIPQSNKVIFIREGVNPAEVKSVAASPAPVPGWVNGKARQSPTDHAGPFPGKKGDFHGYDTYQFRINNGRTGIKIVCPPKAAPGKPWLWRSLFWEAIRRFNQADLKLVEEGYHVVLAHGDVAGHPSGNVNIDAAYEYVTQEHGFARKCNMASMSRGNLSLFRWATENPEKVESIYVDNGVSNVLSWPAGNRVPGNESINPGNEASWEDFKKKFGYKSDAEALKTRESPIDLLEPLAKAGVPILTVCGKNDQAVPYEENDAILEKRYKALGGDITVIVEDKGHSHGMIDPTPVLEFIRKHTAAAMKPPQLLGEGNAWLIDTHEQWQAALADQSNLEIKDGLATPTAKTATFRSKLQTFDQKRSAKSLTINQSPVWHNWEPIPDLGPPNLGDAPVMLSLGPNNYWMFGRYQAARKEFTPEPATLPGFDIPLTTTPFPNQFNAPGGLKKSHGGYHAWQSTDMIHWVHHGAVTEAFSSWVTTAEYAYGKLYIYYDYPNDQDPHLYIDEDLFDGLPGKNMGMAFNDPSHGSDCTFIRDLDGKFHVIYENWDPIDASTHSWDSPLAGHAVSADGIGNFKILAPAVDERTKPTGKFAEYPHPHWHATHPDKYPGKAAPADVPQHRIKKGEVRAFAKYEIHEPEQNAYGDWASISIGGQYYLFADFHPANDHIRVGWFTSSSLDEPFTFCGEIGKGHPDPDILFAEGKFYLATQMRTDYISPGPWVETVEARVGVDTDNDGAVDQWTDWQEVKESYDYIPGYAKQVAKIPAALDLSGLPEGFGFQFEVKISDTTDNESTPILDKIRFSYGE